MYLCANCRTEYPNNEKPCLACGWVPENVQGIDVFLSNADRNDGFFKEYVDNYDGLAMSDMEHGIVEGKYLSNQAEKMLSYYEGKASSILEVGVGKGFLLNKLRPKFPAASITAVDISIPFLTYVKASVDVKCIMANAENLPFSEEFDLLVASDILEHVINPIDFLLSANYSLKPGGSLMLRVPFEDNMLQYSRLLGCKYKFAHLRNFSKRNLTVMLNQAGFEIKQIHYDGYYAYGRRRFFREGKAKELFDGLMDWKYPDKNDVSKISNWLGFFLMKPMEIVVVAGKAKHVTDMNYFT